MAVTEGEAGKLVQLEEKKGVSELSDDYMVRTIGVPVPLLRSKAAFDEDDPPAQGLAISERLGLMFVAHHGGFFVANTKDVLSLAKDMKESNKASSIQDLSIVDILLGGIPFLQLSLDSSTLTACWGGELQFFSTDSLIKKVKEPFMSMSLDTPNHVKDFCWDKSGKNAYVALSSDGMLYHGDLQTQHTVVAENVEAVDWSDRGDLIAIAQMNSVCILSSDFKERCHMPLPPPQEDDATMLEVDSIKWVRNDSIVIGCHQRSEDGIGGGYLVRVITISGSDLTEVSHNAIVTFDSFFLSFSETLLPFGRGPSLFMRYLELWELAIAANRKSIDDHIVLLGWFEDQKLKEPKVIEFQQDKWMPRIQMKANGDENLVVGFCMDVHVDDGIFEIEMDGGGRRQLSYCIMLCLTVDGMLTLFRVAKRSAPIMVSLAPKSSTLGNKGLDTTFAGVQHELNAAVLRPTKHTVEDAGGDDKHLRSDVGPVHSSSSIGYQSIENQSATVESHDLQKSVIQITGESDSSSLEVDKSRERTDTAAKPGVQYSAVKSSCEASPQVPMFGHVQLHVDKGPPRTNSAVKSGVQFSTVESAKSPQVTGPGGFMSKEFQKPFSSIKGAVDMGNSVAHNVLLTTDRSSSQHLLKEEESLVEQLGKGFTVKSSTGLYHSESVASHGYPRLSQKVFSVPLNQKVLAKQDITLNSLSPVVVESDDFSRAFENVKEMAKELDCLLFSIEAEEGYLDESPVFQKGCILAIEESIRSLSKRCRDWKCITNGHLQDILNLQNTAMQAIAREVHMKSMVRQAKNREYWDLWDCQKLRPEFEVKRQKLFKAKQDLIKQLIELERHFNVLELNKFGGEDIKSRVKASQTVMELSRRGHELHSLYSIMNSQLAASTHLSECLSKQMAALNIAPSVKRHEATRELFESIGLAYDEDAFQSPHFNKADPAVHLSRKPLISSLFSCNREEKSNIFQHSESETTRRRRDSMDQNLVGFEPPKTIVKRILREKIPGATVDKFSPEKSKRVFNYHAGLIGSSDKDSEVSLPPPSTSSHLHDECPASEDNCFEEAMKWSSKMPSLLSFNESKSKYTASSNLASDTPGTSVLRVNVLPSMFSESSLTLQSTNIEGSITYDGKSSSVPNAKGSVISTGQACFVTKTGATAPIFNSKLSEQSRITIVPSKVIDQGKASAHAGLQCVNFSDEKLEDNNHRYAAGLEHSLPGSKCRFISSKDPSLLPAGPSVEALQSTHSTGSAQAATTLSTGTSILPKSTSSSPSASPVSTSLVASPVSAFSRSTSILNQPLYVHSLSPTTADNLSEARRQLSADTDRAQSGRILTMARTSQPTLAPPVLLSFQASMGSASSFSSSAETSTSSLLPPSNPLFSVSPTSSSAISAPIPSSGASSGATLAPSSPPVYVDLDHPKGSFSHQTVGLADGHATHGLHETAPTSGQLLSDSKNNIQALSAVLGSPSTFIPPALHVSKSSPQKPNEDTIVSKSDFSPTPATNSKAGVSTGFSFGSPSNLFGSSSSISVSSQQTAVASTSAAENMDATTVQEDEMEEELSDSTTTLNLGSLDAFALGSASSNAPKSSLFGGSFSGSTQANTAISLSVPSDELFKPASFSLPDAQPSKPSGSSLFSGAFGGMKSAMPVNNAFGQPAQIGVGQQALGSVLGSFGQSRQFGVGLPGAGLASTNVFGGGFAGAAASGGFAAAASTGGGFAGAATSGGFAAAGATTGGFGAFSSKPGGGGSSGSNLTASPLSDRFTQIRK